MAYLGRRVDVNSTTWGKTMIFDVGPFRLYRVEKNGTLDISLIAFDNCSFGWEYGWEDPAADRKSWVDFRIGKLRVFQFEKFKEGFEVWLLGFWWVR